MTQLVFYLRVRIIYDFVRVDFVNRVKVVFFAVLIGVTKIVFLRVFSFVRVI